MRVKSGNRWRHDCMTEIKHGGKAAMDRIVVLSICFAVFSLGALNAAEPMATAEVSVDLGTVLGPMKPMHAVNNGPSVNKPGGDQKRGNYETYAAARVPFARTHDSINCVSGGTHTCDINALFPDFNGRGPMEWALK